MSVNDLKPPFNHAKLLKEEIMGHPIECTHCKFENPPASVYCGKCGCILFATPDYHFKYVYTRTTMFLVACLCVGIVLLPVGIGVIPFGIAILGTMFNWGKEYRVIIVPGRDLSGETIHRPMRDVILTERILAIVLSAGAVTMILVIFFIH